MIPASRGHYVTINVTHYNWAEHQFSCLDLEMAVHALITSRLDYCSSLCTVYSIVQEIISLHSTVYNLYKIQLLEHLTVTRLSNNITPVLKSLHWLPVKYRVDFKMLLLVLTCFVFTVHQSHDQSLYIRQSFTL